ncbi:hypothetical protein PoHVEF18_007692 [Penicillium ochrochloron]
MADEETISINGVKVVKLRGSSNYHLWLASLQRALEVPDPKLWRLMTGQDPMPGDDPAFLPLTTKDFSRHFVAKKLGIDLEAVTEQYLSDCAADLKLVRDTIISFDYEACDKWVERDIPARALLRSTTSDYLEYDLDPDEDFDCDQCAGYFRHLQARYGPTGYLTIHGRWKIWTSLRYTGANYEQRKKFVSRFKAAKVRVEQALVTSIDSRLDFSQFLSAISGREECESLLTPPLGPPSGFHKEKDIKAMEDVYKKFIGRAAESR